MGARVPTKFKERKATPKSGKLRRAEITARRKKQWPVAEHVDRFSLKENWPKEAIAANHEQLRHINTYGLLPYFYVDQAFVCRDCGVEEIWRATQKKWHYEEAKGHIDAKAIRCRLCRRKERERKNVARERFIAGLIAKRERLSKQQ